MIIPVCQVTYLHPFSQEAETYHVGDTYVDWQGMAIANIASMQVFTGTGIRFLVGDNNQECWIHWGRIIEWVVTKTSTGLSHRES